MIKQEMLKATGLNLHDITVRYALRNARSRGRVPERFLGSKENGEIRSQQEARTIFSKVRQVLRFLHEQELRDKAFMKKIKREDAKRRKVVIKELEAEAVKLEKAVHKNERLKMIERSAIKQKLEKVIPLRPVQVRAPKKINTSEPHEIRKADGKIVVIQPQRARTFTKQVQTLAFA